MIAIMTAYVALNNDTAVKCEVEIIGTIAGRTACFECGGTGQWPWHPDGQVRQCVDCKGTGKVYVSV
jgi:DnaJ-class molecular chaperone